MTSLESQLLQAPSGSQIDTYFAGDDGTRTARVMREGANDCVSAIPSAMGVIVRR